MNYEKALELSEGEPEHQAHIYRRLGTLYHKMEQDAQSLNAYNKALKLAPDYVESYLFYWNMGVSAIDLGMWEKALELYEKCLVWADDSSKKGEVYYQIGLILRQLSRFEDAKDAYKCSLKYMSIYDVRRESIFAFFAESENAYK